MSDKMREQFEARYPVPEGCCWNADQGRYVLFHLKLCTVAKYERFVESWVCWQASREAATVEIKRYDQSYGCDEWHESADGSMMDSEEAIQALEIHGIKVKS